VGELIDLASVRRLRAERDHRVAEELWWLDRQLTEVAYRVSECALVLGESTDRAELSRARRWLLRLAQQGDALRAQKRALETPRVGGRRHG
jgi:hypothetical protein